MRATIGLFLLALTAGASHGQVRSFLPGLVPQVRGLQYQILDAGRRADTVRERRVATVQSQADFESLWDQTFVSSGPIPEIDWSYQQVVGIFSGIRPGTGYDISLRSVRSVDGVILIGVTEITPPPGMLLSSLESSPFMLILLTSRDPVQVVWNDAPVPQPAGSIQILDKGERVDSVLDRGQLVMRNQRDFESVWQDVHGGRASPPPLPEVDWSSYQVAEKKLLIPQLIGLAVITFVLVGVWAVSFRRIPIEVERAMESREPAAEPQQVVVGEDGRRYIVITRENTDPGGA